MDKDAIPTPSGGEAAAPAGPRLAVTSRLQIPWEALTFVSCRASGAGGQHVNTTDSAVQLRLDLALAALPSPLLARLRHLAGHKLSRDGTLQITAQTHRQQGRNKAEALERLLALLRQAAQPPRPRQATRVPNVSRQQRRAGKKLRSECKQQRRAPGHADD